MINSFFVFGKGDIKIERFHLCTWDLSSCNSFIELGFEIQRPENENKIDERVELTITSPLLQRIQSSRDIVCLAKRLIQSNNCKFIFNDSIKSWSEIKEDSRNGVNLTFVEKGKLTILPIEIEELNTEKGYLSLSVDIPKSSHKAIYFRILIKTQVKTIALVKKNITSSTYIYDIRVNEQRNLSDQMYDIVKRKHLEKCNIKTFFCFHIVPNTFEISFVDDEKLNSVRMLETDLFSRYLSDEIEQNIENKKYIILFNKKDPEEYPNKPKGCSFFSILKKESIGTDQIILAIGTNIACSLLFAFAVFRKENGYFQEELVSAKWYEKLPFEYWLVFVILLGLLLYLIPIRKFLSKLVYLFKRRK